ncbi:MAG: SUMF1/EgtB/PvdO family nonheme iron enzyme, partial [Bacteroidota bacterium]
NKTDCISEVKKYFSYKGRQYVTSGNKDERTPAKSAFAAKFLETLRKDYNADKMIFFDDLAYKLSKAGSTNPENGTFTGHDPGSSFVFARKDACVNLSDRDSDGVSDDKDGCPDKWSSNPSGCPDDDKGGSNTSADLAAWRRAKEQNSISAFNDYLIGFPNGEFREEAVLKLKDLEQEQKVRNDNSAWELAVEKNNKEGYQKYLDKYPSGLHAAEARKRLDESDKPDFMVLIPGGTFNMGSENGDSDEKPVHRVTLNDFYLGKYEVTVAEFRVFVNDTGFKTDAEKGDGSTIYESGSWNKKSGINWRNDTEGKTAQDNHPVIHVSWNDAKAYCDWLSKKSSKNYRLPTEAEWEYGAKGGKQSQGYEYAGSNNVGDVGWHNSNSGNKTHPVGEKRPNELGLYDMTGNVWEWCSDW